MKKKKILFFINTLSGGGAEKTLINILKYIDKEKFEITVQTISNEGTYILDILNLPVIYKTMIKNRTTWLGKLMYKIIFRLIKHTKCKMLYKLFIKSDYDIEIAFLEGAPTKIIGSTQSNEKVRKIAWVHTDTEQNRESDIFFKNKMQCVRIYQNFAKIVLVSKSTKEAFSRKLGINEKIVVQKNVIDCKSILDMANEEIINSEIRETEHKKIFAIGRLVPQKGFDRLLRVHKKLIDDGLIHELYILGEGELRKSLEGYIEENKLEDTVKLLGYKKNPYQYLKQADIFALSSVAEGYSLVVAEALILEKVIIATKCSGPNEILENGKYGMLVDNSEDGIYNGLKLLLENDKLYHEYKAKVKEGKDLFDVNRTIKEIENIILE